MPTNRVYRIAVIPGDGIGKEVVPEGMRVLEAAAKKFGFELRSDDFDFASCDYYEKHEKMMPDDWKERIGKHDAIFFGAVGWPAKVPDHISLWGSLILFRREFDQYVNLRPVRLMPGVPSPLAGRKPGDIDFWVVRENTEGEYSAIGGRMFQGTEREVVVQETVMSRIGVDRVLKFAFELARKTPKKHLTSATKSNGIAITMPYWDERVEEMAKQFPDIKWDKYHIDILTALFVLKPDRFNVVVASNLFGDILSDLGPGLHRHHRHRAVRQHQSGAEIPLGVRAGARLCAGHRRPGHRQPDRPDLVGRDDARASGRDRSRRRDRQGDREGAGRAEAPHPRSRRAGRHRRLRQGGRRRARLAGPRVTPEASCPSTARSRSTARSPAAPARRAPRRRRCAIRRARRRRRAPR